jgi:aminoglycoside phosphotransferase (APT) family kinase protein
LTHRKTYRGRRAWKARKEVRVNALLAAQGVPVPDVLELIEDDAAATIVMRAAGRPLVAGTDALRELGQWFERLHSIEAASFDLLGPAPEPLDDVIAFVDRLCDRLLVAVPGHALGATIEWVRADLRARVPGSGGPVFCHGDLHFANVLHDPEALIDFESSCWGPAAFDVAKTLVVCSRGAPLELAGLRLAGAPDAALVSAFARWHALDGFLHAALLERRDVELWQRRLNGALATNALPTDGEHLRVRRQ